MQKKSLILIFLLFELSIIFYGNSFLGLFESSEGRYAEVSREMLETKDFISPQMDYVYHFTKPPLAYWMTSLGMAIFGVNPFGVRFFIAIFAILTMVVAYKISEELGADSFTSMLILGSFPLFFIMSKVLTTDMYLTFFVTLGVYLFLLYDKKKIDKLRFSIYFGITFALAVLTKGYVPILYWAMIFITYAFFKKDFSSLKGFLSPLFILIALTLSCWWFVLVGIKHPGLLHYLFFKEGVEASYSSQRFHPGPIYYYIPVLLAGLFPLIFLFPNLKELKEERSKLLYGYTFLPFIIFSFFPAKLPTYLLPSLPGWAILFSLNTSKKMRVILSALFLFLFQTLLSLIIILRGEKLLQVKAADVSILLLISSFFSLLSLFIIKRKGEKIALVVIFISILVSSISLPQIVSKNQEKFKIAKEISYAIKENLSSEDKVLELRTTIFSIPFYLERKVYAFQNNFFRKKFLSNRPEHILQEEDELKEFIKNSPFLFVIVDKKSEPYLNENYPQFKLLKRGERYILYCSQDVYKRIKSD
jgi:4-amino-4-deoxy-L-arabinose transferase